VLIPRAEGKRERSSVLFGAGVTGKIPDSLLHVVHATSGATSSNASPRSKEFARVLSSRSSRLLCPGLGWHLKIVRWIARVLATVLATLVFLLAIGEGFNPAKVTIEEALMMMGFLAAWLGFIVGWKWEGTGGALVIGGLLWHCVFEYVLHGTMFLGLWITLPALPGVLYLISWWRTRPSAPSDRKQGSAGASADPG